eukprot:GHVO01004540.1.p1 GENE.GHVO01004540.1~~GHVO01004540.1.p1  ORF type:complete len:102 (+),score=1.79 GHVO01004540.1:33-338(+)
MGISSPSVSADPKQLHAKSQPVLNTWHLNILANLIAGILGVLAIACGIYLSITCFWRNKAEAIVIGEVCGTHHRVGGPLSICTGAFAIFVAVGLLHQASWQ